MKLEYKIKYGIFIRKKFYYILDSQGEEIMKSSGINPKLLNKNKYIKLLNGEDVTTETTNFRLSWKKLTLNLSKKNITSKGLYTPIKTI
jgi:hypothetical protein